MYISAYINKVTVIIHHIPKSEDLKKIITT